MERFDYDANHIESFPKSLQLHLPSNEKRKEIITLETTFQQKKEIIIEPLPFSNECYHYFRKYLETDEKILQIFIPSINFIINICLTGIGILLLILSLVIIGVFASLSLMFPLMLSFGFALLCCGFLIFQTNPLAYKLFHRNSMFVLTSKKIIGKYPKNCFLIDYADIISLSRKNKKNTYDIELNLSTPVKNYPLYPKNPLYPKTKVLIPLIPHENNLVEILNYLRKYLKKMKYLKQLKYPFKKIPEKIEIVGKCIVCKLSIYASEQITKCPICNFVAHRTHLLEWIKIKGKCPNCKANLKYTDFNPQN